MKGAVATCHPLATPLNLTFIKSSSPLTCPYTEKIDHPLVLCVVHLTNSYLCPGFT